MSFKNSNILTLYHGTPNGHIREFDTTPIYFTDKLEVAVGYAEGNYSRDNSDESSPVIVCAHLDIKNPKVFTHEELLTLISADDETIEWCDFEHICFTAEGEGFDAIIIKDSFDYAGGLGENKRYAVYDQYVVFNAEQVLMVDHKPGQRVPNSSSATFRKSPEPTIKPGSRREFDNSPSPM